MHDSSNEAWLKVNANNPKLQANCEIHLELQEKVSAMLNAKRDLTQLRKEKDWPHMVAQMEGMQTKRDKRREECDEVLAAALQQSNVAVMVTYARIKNIIYLLCTRIFFCV